MKTQKTIQKCKQTDEYVNKQQTKNISKYLNESTSIDSFGSIEVLVQPDKSNLLKPISNRN